MVGDDHTAAISALAAQISELETENEHFRAVQAQIAFAGDIYRGLLETSSSQNGLASAALLRTLFEVAVSAIVLAKHSEKLPDFVRHGRFTESRLIRSVEVPALRDRLASEGTEAEFQNLWAEFKEQRWHKMGTRQSFGEAEFPEGIYDKYYRPASAFAHGQPYVTARDGKVRARRNAWRNHSVEARNMAGLIMVVLIAITNREFGLRLDREIAVVAEEADARAKSRMQAIKSALAID